MMRRLSMVIAAGTAWTMSGVALAQVKIVDEPAGTPAAAAPAPQAARAASAPRAMSADEQIMLEARRMLANMQAGKAQDLLDAWIERNAGGQSPQLPEAYYLRGNAKLAQDDVDHQALRRVERAFPKSGEVTAFRPEFAVHGKFGEPCPVCSSPVMRIIHAENETNYCATCQTAGKVLADRSMSRLLKDDWPRTLAEWNAE